MICVLTGMALISLHLIRFTAAFPVIHLIASISIACSLLLHSCWLVHAVLGPKSTVWYENTIQSFSSRMLAATKLTNHGWLHQLSDFSSCSILNHHLVYEHIGIRLSPYNYFHLCIAMMPLTAQLLASCA